VQIRFERSGGVAGLAARRSVRIDTASLPEDEARELRQLVESADVFGAPTPAPQGDRPDGFHYLVEVEDEGRSAVLHLADREMTEPQRRLVNWLNRHATPGGAKA
jgi:hypothetical protein